MKNKILLYSFLFIPLEMFVFLNNSFAQNSKYEFSFEILKCLDSVKDFQNAATKLSFIGEYKKDIEIWDSNPEEQKFYTRLAEEDRKDFNKRYRAVHAREYIIEQARNKQVVMINEAHHQPMHRIFTESLLHDLYKMGFRYFGAETFSYIDPSINERKYPGLSSGYYTTEPQFGNMVRTALKEGFTTFPYEADFKDSTNREIQQAAHIKAILDKDPKARIIIYCGYGHLCEEQFGDFIPMGARFKKLTGIDPLTIDQQKMTEHSNEISEEDYFTEFTTGYDAVYIDSNGLPYSHGLTDIQVFHKRSSFINGRPDWVFLNGRKACPIVEKIKTGFPCLVFAYHSNEDVSIAVPADIIEVNTKLDDKVLALPKGKYKIIIKDKDGGKQVFTTKF